MSTHSHQRGSEVEAKLSIGALAHATGIAVETLRTWESRYGFPVPERKPSGHRLYLLSDVPRLRRMAEALVRGHRAGEVVGAPDEVLAELLQATPTAGPDLPAHAPIAAGDVSEVLRAVEAFDAERLTRQLMADWAYLGPLDFLQARVAPIIRAVGDAWETGKLEIRHEHFLSERVGDLLRVLRLPFEGRATGPLVVFATLPGESHALGLQMAALVLAIAGCRIRYVGTEVPVPQVASLAKQLHARAVAMSASAATRGPATVAQLRRLRLMMPRRVALLVGGEGAPHPRPGLEVPRDFAALDAWGRQLVVGA